MTPRPPPLIGAETLSEALGAARLRIIDIRYGKDAAAAFERSHIPGAVHSDYGRDGWRGQAGGVDNIVPPVDHIARLFGDLGIGPDDHVVIVTPAESANHAGGAARAYWTLKWAGHRDVSILDGGMRQWLADPARPVAIGPAPRPGGPPYPVRLDAAGRSDLMATVQALRMKTAALLDARAMSYFVGAEKSADVLTAGRLPGALQRNYAEAFDPDSGQLRTTGTLESLYADVPDGPVINYCNTGHTAALNWFVLSELLARPEVTLFDGSMSEWALEPGRPIMTGP